MNLEEVTSDPFDTYAQQHLENEEHSADDSDKLKQTMYLKLVIKKRKSL